MENNTPEFWHMKRKVHTEGASPGYNESIALASCFDIGRAFDPTIRSVLDYGCGNGRFSGCFHHRSAEYIGYDWALPANLKQDASHVGCDFFTDKLPESHFDLIVFHAVLLHNTDSQIEGIVSSLPDADHILIVEMLGHEWRGHVEGNPPVYNRNAGEYVNIFQRDILFELRLQHQHYAKHFPERNTKVSYLWLK